MADEAGLYELRVLEEHSDNAPEHAEVVEAIWVGTGVVRHAEKEEDENEVLHAEGEQVDAPPASVLRQDARKKACGEHPKHEARHDNRERRCSVARGSQVTDKGEHELGGHRHHSHNEGQRQEHREGLRQAQAEPLRTSACEPRASHRETYDSCGNEYKT